MAVIELRQYTLHPGARDRLVDLFDAHFLEGQEQYGMSVLGQFRNLDSPDRFVWLRAFSDMGSRRRALEGFYNGPVWLAHRDAANATMIAFDDVLLLRPVEPSSGFQLDRASRPSGAARSHLPQARESAADGQPDHGAPLARAGVARHDGEATASIAIAVYPLDPES